MILRSGFRQLSQSAVFIVLLAFTNNAFTSTDAATELRQIEQRIEDAVVKADLKYLRSVYASDFRFTHGDGQVQSKKEWLELVAKRECVSRSISVAEVELHGNIAITTGRLDVVWRGSEMEDRYALRYVRVYRLANGKWLLVSHRTVEMLKD
jgi:ketosteroid isomerase-like protein